MHIRFLVERSSPMRSHHRRSRRRLLVLLTAFLLPVGGLLALLGPAATATVTASAVPAPPSGWTTVFSDDFTGSAGSGLNTSNWLYDTGTGYSGGAANWGTNEVETMTSSTNNVYQDGNGHLVIKPIRDSAGNWTSGRVETQRTDFAAPAGGELELSASIEQPNPSSGLGYWPAFWALGAGARTTAATDWPAVGELDTMEDVNALSEYAQTLHCGTDPGGPCNETTGLGSGLVACSGCQTGYHTYSVIVDRTNTSAEQLRFYKDGTLNYTINESQIGTSYWQQAIDHGFFMILDVAMGGAFPNAICGCTSPSSATTSGAGMSVDWVAAYETGGSGGTSATATATSGGGSSCTTTATSDISADCYAAATLGGASVTTTSDSNPSGVDGNQVAQLSNGASLRYDNVNFGSTGSTQFDARVASGASSGVSGLVEVVLDNPSNSPVGSFAVGNTGGWSSWTTIPANITRTTGTHTVYLVFSSGASSPYVSLHWFDFPTS
jgi:hypothetical protein